MLGQRGDWRGAEGGCLAKRGRFAEGETLLLRSLDELAGSMGEDHERAVEGRRKLVAPYARTGYCDGTSAMRETYSVKRPV